MSTLLVAAAGGHLRQLHELRRRLPGTDDVTWVTFDTAQSRSLLDGERVHYATYPQPRAIGANVRNTALARRVLREQPYDRVISTGSSIAVSFLPLAGARTIPSHYIESATRVQGPSLTGRILRRIPNVHVYTQYASWAQPPWRYRGSIFDGYGADERVDRPIRRALVTVGTAEGYGFRSLVEAALKVIPADVDVVWQTGSTDVDDLPIDGHVAFPSDRFDEMLAEVDVVITHAGTGSSLAALRAGAFPLLVPRRKARHEHIDDHQVQIADELDRRGLARRVEVDALSIDDLRFAARRRVRLVDEPPLFELDE
jgi:UDP-N-acetylglucosamine--N-acetylmuramyl-(pentapeptide) pyrophosphoryl-undecaprenol N-acetylglucosamine transferase